MLIASQTGNSEFNADMVTDDMLNGLILEEEQEEVETEESETEEENEEEVETQDEEESEDPFENIDINSLSPTERLFYDHIISEKKKAKQREISLVIQGSNLDIKHKLILDRMAKDGVPLGSIQATIEDFKQIQASNTRTAGSGKLVSKSKMKTKTSTAQKTAVPKIGTREFGKYLAELKKGNK